MIDRFFYAFFGSIDRVCEKLNETVDDLWTFDFPNYKPKKKKNENKRKH